VQHKQVSSRPAPSCAVKTVATIPQGPYACTHLLLQVKNLEWELEVLQQRFGKVQAERDELYDKFQGAIHDVQQKTGGGPGGRVTGSMQGCSLQTCALVGSTLYSCLAWHCLGHLCSVASHMQQGIT
jgi:hypothetical protein